MSLQFIFGNSGSGKSTYLRSDIIKSSVEHPEKTHIMLVPEQFTMQTQKDLCFAHPAKGILNIDVLSFERLAYRIFQEVGHDSRTIIDDEGKNLILRRVAGECKDELVILKKNLKKQGYINEVKSIISEFTQYGVGPEQLTHMIESTDSGSYLHYKLRDIKRVYDAFEDYIQEKYFTKEELLDVLSESVPKSNILKNSVICMDGFTGFTPVQVRLICELLKFSDKIMITVDMDKRENPYQYTHPYQLFALSKHMVTSLTDMCKEENIPVDEPVYLYTNANHRFAQNPSMMFLEENLFRYSSNTYTGASNLSLHETKNPKEEAMYVAEAIRKLVRTKGYRYRDFAVIISNPDTYANHLESAFECYHIPMFMDHKRSILQNSFIEYIRSLLSIAEQNYTYESVFRFMRTGLCDFTSDEIDMMDNYCLAVGIKGFKKWDEKWTRRTKDMDGSELETLNAYRERFISKMIEFREAMKQPRKTVEDITRAIYLFLVRENIQSKVNDIAENFQATGELSLSKEYAQVYRVLLNLFDKFVELLGSERVTTTEYCALLDAGLQEVKIGVIPPSIDQVVIGDIERTRLNDIKYLFVMGANDDLLPGDTAAQGFLSERDRDKFRMEKISLSPGPKEQIYTQKFYLYMQLTKPTEGLFLSWSRVSNDGKAVRPAYLVQEIRRLYPSLNVINESEKPLVEKELTRSIGNTMIAFGLQDKENSKQWTSLFSWMKNDSGEKNDLGRIISAADSYHKDAIIDQPTASILFGDPDKLSVTRMERFYACPYAHFLNYGLRLEERERYEFKPTDLGNIAHKALERFSKTLLKKNKNWPDLSEMEREELIDQCVDDSIVDYNNTILYDTARNEYMIRRIKILLRRSVWALSAQMKAGDFKTSANEFNFGKGKIDRIDTYANDDKVYVKVTDYKTGQKSFDIVSFYHGLQMQLPVYMNAAMENEKKHHPEKEIIPAGVFYYKIQDPFIKGSKGDTEDALLGELKLDGLVNGEEDVVEHLEHNLSGTSKYYPIRTNKDGSLGSSSNAVTQDEMSDMLAYTEHLEQESKDRIQGGDASVLPYKYDGVTACDHCKYKDICGFDKKIDGFHYRNIASVPKDHIIAAMKDNKNKKN